MSENINREYYTDRKGVNHKIIRKRIDDCKMYAYADLLSDIKSNIDAGLSGKSQFLFQELIMSIDNDIGHLKCDELTDSYAVEEATISVIKTEEHNRHRGETFCANFFIYFLFRKMYFQSILLRKKGTKKINIISQN